MFLHHLGEVFRLRTFDTLRVGYFCMLVAAGRHDAYYNLRNVMCVLVSIRLEVHCFILIIQCSLNRSSWEDLTLSLPIYMSTKHCRPAAVVRLVQLILVCARAFIELTCVDKTQGTTVRLLLPHVACRADIAWHSITIALQLQTRAIKPTTSSAHWPWHRISLSLMSNTFPGP
jgi:hypothetical protein